MNLHLSTTLGKIIGMKYIPNCADSYAVTSDGRVWSYPKSNPHGYGSQHDGKFLSAGDLGNGYLVVNLKFEDGKYRTRLVHRLVAEAYIPNPLNLPQVNHKNGIKTDNRVENLEWVNNSQNMLHSVKIGTYNHTRLPSDKYMKKINRDDIKRIIDLCKQGLYHQLIADEFGVSRSYVSYLYRKSKS